MPWGSYSTMSLRKEFVVLASQKSVNLAELCRRFGISRKTGYKWLGRFGTEGVDGLEDRSRRPLSAAPRLVSSVEETITGLRAEHPAWGARKLRKLLENTGISPLPARSTITEVLRRNGLLDGKAVDRQGGKAWQRFEHPAPNCLWQMDFKGTVATLSGKCEPLTVLDDYSRYAVCLRAFADQKTETVTAALTDAFRMYGLPDSINVDNGSPWGDGPGSPYTRLVVWLIRLGIRVSHSRPYHPQTNGKDERFHRTLKAEVLAGRQWPGLAELQSAFDIWRRVYNLERPHEALGLDVPMSRYRPSLRPFPERLPDIEYPNAYTCYIRDKGAFKFMGRSFKVAKSFKGYPIGVMPTTTDGVFNVFFCNQRISKIDLRDSNV